MSDGLTEREKGNRYILFWVALEVILLIILISPRGIGINRWLARHLVLDSPTSFVKQYGSLISFLVVVAVIIAIISFKNSYAEVQSYNFYSDCMEEFYMAQSDMYLHGFGLFLFVVLVGVLALWRDIFRLENRGQEQKAE